MNHNRLRTLSIPFLSFAAAALAGSVVSHADGLPISAPSRSDAVRFQDEILPILAANCTACHNEKIHEGGLILDSLKAILTGGDSGPGVIAGIFAVDGEMISLLDLDNVLPPLAEAA
jgi:hypothetical protein